MKTTKSNTWHYQNVAIALLYSVLAVSLIFMWRAPAAAARLGIEDGPAENVTALLMLIASIVMAVHGVRYLKIDASISGIALFMAVMFFIFAGEEISWGQRIIGLESNDFILEYNWQGEINFHNLHTDLFNIAFHYGAFIFLVVLPFTRSRIAAWAKKFRLGNFTHFIPPVWIAIPSFTILGMLDSRFLFIIEKPWAASFYIALLVVGSIFLAHRLITSVQNKDTLQTIHLGLSSLLIGLGLFVSYVYAVDEQATNIISEYKELYIALALCFFALTWKMRR